MDQPKPKRATRQTCAWTPLLLSFVSWGCGYIGLDQSGDDSSTGGLGGDVSSNVKGGDGDSNASGGENSGDGDGDVGFVETESGGSTSSGGTTSSGGADGVGGATSAGDGGADSAGGTGGGPRSRATCDAAGRDRFGFDSGDVLAQGSNARGRWGMSSASGYQNGTLDWTSGWGNRSSGALVLEIEKPTTGRQVMIAQMDLEGLDLTDKVVVAHLYVQSGEDALVQVFARSEGTDRTWSDGEPVHLPVGEWACATLDLADPYYREENFDPTNVTTLGVEVWRDEESTLDDTIVVYLDDFSY